jgi:hypothetical protein
MNAAARRRLAMLEGSTASSRRDADRAARDARARAECDAWLAGIHRAMAETPEPAEPTPEAQIRANLAEMRAELDRACWAVGGMTT